MKKEVEIVSTDGVTLFIDTVIGFIEGSDKYITVGSLMVEWQEARQKTQQKIEELCDSMRVLLDECQQERVNHRFNTELLRAMEQAASVLSGPTDDRPLEEQPYYVGRAAGERWREGGLVENGGPPVNPHPVGSVAFSEWRMGYSDGYHRVHRK